MNKKETTRDFNVILKGSSSTGLGRLSDTFLRYVTNIVLTRLLGVEMFGIFILARTIVMIAGMVSNLGMGFGVVRQIAYYSAKEDESNIQQSIRIALIVPAIVSILTALLLFFGGNHIAIAFFKKPELALPLKILVFSVPILTISQILLEVARGFKKITIRVIVEYFFIPISNLGFILFFYFLGYKLEGAILAFILSTLLSLVILIILHRNIIQFPRRESLFQKEEAIRFFKFSFPLTFVSIFNEIKLRLDVLLLGILSTATNTSIFFIALRLGSFLAIPSQASHMIFAPMVSGYYGKGEIDKIESSYKNLTKLMFIGGMFLMGFIVVFSKELLSMFGTEFEKGMVVVSLICLGQLVKILVGNAGIILVMVGKPVVNMIILIVSLILLSVTNILLVPKYGLIGAGIANFVTVWFTSLMELYFVYRFLHIHPFRIDFLKPVVAALLSMAPIFLLKRFFPSNIPVTIALMIFFAALFLGGLFILQLSEEEKAVLVSLKLKLKRWIN